MHTTNIYAVKDIKSGIFSTFHTHSTDGLAIRSFAQGCEMEQSDLHKYPSDFSLYSVGTIAVDTGIIQPEKTPRQIANASEFAKSINAPALPIK